MQTPTSQQVSETLNPTLVVGFVGFIGTMITVIATWIKDRNLDAKCIQIIDEATKYMLFWDQYYKALVAAGSTADLDTRKAKAIAHINGAADFLAQRLTALQDRVEKKERPNNRFRKWFLLYKPNRGFTWVIRVFFYLYAFGGSLAGLTFVADKLIANSPISWGFAIVISVIYIVVCNLFALPIRIFSEWYDKRTSVRAVLKPLHP